MSSTADPVASHAPLAHGREAHARAHSVQFYVDDGILLDDLGRLIGSALEAGDAGVVIATPAHRAGLAERLAVRGVGLTEAERQGRYLALDAGEILARVVVDGWPDPERFLDVVGGVVARASAAAGGAHPRVAAFGEIVALVWEDGEPEMAIRLEQLWNELGRARAFDLHCAYPMRLFPRAGDGGNVARICAEHSHVTPAESYTALGDAERPRAVVLLQQKAQALEAEIAERGGAQEVLQRRETELRARNAELSTAVAVRDEFLAIAAHELKTPVTGLRSFAQILLRQARREGKIAPERLDAGLRAIESQTARLSGLVEHLLDAAQAEAGTLRVETTLTDLVALVRSALARQPARAAHRIVFDSPGNVVADVDPVRLGQVVTNLVDNAVRFSPEGGVVLVALTRADAGIRLSISDDGVGVPPDQREAVFDRFRPAHGDGHLSGLGLGLFVTREIVELHGGSVRIEDSDHSGARFVVTLPSTGAGTLATPSTLVGGHVPRVLVVDDDETIRTAIVFALDDEGYEVDEASDGQAALDLVDRRPPDVILLDMKMPGLDGWGFMESYRQRAGRRAPVIVVTAADDARERAADIGADDYISKPFDVYALVQRVAAAARQFASAV